MTLPLQQVKVAFLCADGMEQIELEAPLNAVRQAGATAAIASIEKGAVGSIESDERADSFDVDSLVADIEARAFAALVIPSGKSSIGALAAHEGAKALVVAFCELDKTVAAIGALAGCGRHIRGPHAGDCRRALTRL